MPNIVEDVETEVQYMEDMDVQWISLVDKGANRTPFKIIKTEDAMEEVIQSIITPLAKDFDNYKALHEWPEEFKILKTENHGEYSKFISINIEDIDPSSVKLVRLSEDEHVFAIVGIPLKMEGANIIYKSVMRSPVSNDSPEGGDGGGGCDGNSCDNGMYVQTFGDLFFEELDNMLKVVIGSMELTEMTNKMKKTIVFNALDSFKSFLAVGLDASASQLAVAKREKRQIQRSEVNMDVKDEMVTEVIVEKVEASEPAPVVETVVAAEPKEYVNKTEEKLLEMLAVLTQKIEDLSVKTDSIVKKEEPEVVEKVEEVKEEVVKTEGVTVVPFAKFEETLDGMKVKLEKLEQLVEKIDADVPEPSVVQEPVVKEEPVVRNESPFSGIFGNLRRK